MDKKVMVNTIIKRLENKRKELKNLIKDLEERRNDAPTRNESRYDSTRAELQYSINAYLKQLEELDSAIAKLKECPIKHRENIDVGSLVTLDNGLTLLVLPACGGEKIEYNGSEVMVISMASPIFSLLKGKKKGDRITMLNGSTAVIKELV